MALKSRLQPRPDVPVQERVHFTATVVLAREAPAQPSESSFTHPEPEEFGLGEDAIYRVYFHGPAFKVLEGVRLDAAHAVGLMAANLPPETSPAAARTLVAPRLIELCFQTAGILEMKEHERLGLPTAIRSVAVFRRPDQANGRRLYAEVWHNGSPEEYEARVVDEAGDVYVELHGYRTIALPGRLAAL
jgi:hypothetical protein